MTGKNGGRHCSCCHVRGPEVQSPTLVEEIAPGTEARIPGLPRKSDSQFPGRNQR